MARSKHDLPPYIEFVFPVQGRRISVDHGWSLFAAISRHCPILHERNDIALGPLQKCDYAGEGELRLRESSGLPLRLPMTCMRDLLPLAGKQLEVGEHTIRLGIPETRMLHPSASLNARIVIISNNETWDDFREALQRQLDDLDVSARIHRGRRRILTIKGFKNVGFGVELSQLSDADALCVMTRGLGGRRSMGAGFFIPGRLAHKQVGSLREEANASP